MPLYSHRRLLTGLALLTAVSFCSAIAQDDDHDQGEIKHVFVIALENHNWTQPITIPGSIQPVYQNPNAPLINSLVNGTVFAYVDGHLENMSEHGAYAAAYHNVLVTAGGNNPHIHPSQPNYLQRNFSSG
jgi:phosphatidylinositol-3-phosphatase